MHFHRIRNFFVNRLNILMLRIANSDKSRFFIPSNSDKSRFSIPSNSDKFHSPTLFPAHVSSCRGLLFLRADDSFVSPRPSFTQLHCMSHRAMQSQSPDVITQYHLINQNFIAAVDTLNTSIFLNILYRILLSACKITTIFPNIKQNMFQM